MIGRSFVTTLLVWTAAAAAIAAQPTAEKAPGARPEQIARVAEPGDLVVEMQAHRRSGVVSAWLVNGIRVHHRRMTVQPDQIEVMISFAGGELLECPETRGLSLLCAALLDRPSSRAIAQGTFGSGSRDGMCSSRAGRCTTRCWCGYRARRQIFAPG